MSKSSGKSQNKSGARRPQRGGAKVATQREMARMQQRQRERIRRMTMIVGGFVGALVLIAALAQSLAPTQIAPTAGATPAAASTSPIATPATTPIVRQVDVTLTDNAIASSVTSFTTGVQYHFVVHNTGQAPQDFLIVPPAQGNTSLAQVEQTALVTLSARQLAPGVSQTFDFVFDTPAIAGQLELAAPLKSNYAAGNHLAITVAKG